LSIDVFDGETPASGWRRAHGDDLTEAAVTNGCLDGGTFEPGRLADDGIPLEGVTAYVTLLRTIACQHFRTTPRHA